MGQTPPVTPDDELRRGQHWAIDTFVRLLELHDEPKELSGPLLAEELQELIPQLSAQTTADLLLVGMRFASTALRMAYNDPATSGLVTVENADEPDAREFFNAVHDHDAERLYVREAIARLAAMSHGIVDGIGPPLI